MPAAEALGVELVSLLSAVFDSWPRDGLSWQYLGESLAAPDLVRELLELDPHKIAYLGRPHYLASSLSVEAHRACFLHHYLFLAERLNPEAVHALFFGELVLWHSKVNNTRYQVSVRLSRNTAHEEAEREGELTLIFKRDEDELYFLSFSFVPGYAVGRDDRHAILIGRMQGERHKSEDIRAATKEFNDISPQAIVFAVIRGVASAVGLSYVAGVAGSNHPSYRPPNIERIEKAYDGFYRSLGACAAQAGFFFIESEIAPRTYASHRCRKRAKRQFKSKLSEAAARAWNNALIATAPQPGNPTQPATPSRGLEWYNAGSRDFVSYFPGPGNGSNYATLIGVIDKLDKQSAAAAHQIEKKKLETAQLEAEIATTRTVCEAVISAGREALDASFSRRSRTNIRSRRFDPSRVFAAALNRLSVHVLGKPHPIIVADRGRDARQYGLAAAYYRKALSGSPELSPIWVQYGNMLKEEARLAEAENAYRLALAQEPDIGDTHLQLAHLLKLQGRTGEAQNAYLRAFLLDRSLHESLRELGALGWRDDALALLRQLANA